MSRTYYDRITRRIKETPHGNQEKETNLFQLLHGLYVGSVVREPPSVVREPPSAVREPGGEVESGHVPEPRGTTFQEVQEVQERKPPISPRGSCRWKERCKNCGRIIEVCLCDDDFDGDAQQPLVTCHHCKTKYYTRLKIIIEFVPLKPTLMDLL